MIPHPLTFTVLSIVKHRQSIAVMSDYSGSPSDHMESQPPKRKATNAGLDGNTTGRSVKRRASKACQCCRARKVRCNVTEHGAPCTNCRLDEVDCIVSESRRKKSVTHPVQHPTTPPNSIILHLLHIFANGISRSPFVRRHPKVESVFAPVGLATCGHYLAHHFHLRS